MPNPTYIKIATVTVGAGGAASIDFTSIPNTYTDLVIKASTRRDTSTGSGGLQLKFNGATTNYSYRRIYGTGSGAASDSNSSDTSLYVGEVGNASNTASTFMSNDIYIPNYTSSNTKSVSADAVSENNATAAIATLIASLWNNTAAITSISLLPAAGNFVQYSTATLYGILKN